MQDNERDRTVILRRTFLALKGQNVQSPDPGVFGVVTGALNKYLGGRDKRIAFYQWAFDDPFIVSSKDLEPWQRFALVTWAQPVKLAEGVPWSVDRQFHTDCSVIKMILEAQTP